MKKAADYFNVDYRSLLKHLDTEIATMKGGKLVLLFSHELTEFSGRASAGVASQRKIIIIK
jgi:hypothetical protein